CRDHLVLFRRQGFLQFFLPLFIYHGTDRICKAQARIQHTPPVMARPCSQSDPERPVSARREQKISVPFIREIAGHHFCAGSVSLSFCPDHVLCRLLQLLQMRNRPFFRIPGAFYPAFRHLIFHFLQHSVPDLLLDRLVLPAVTVCHHMETEHLLCPRLLGLPHLCLHFLCSLKAKQKCPRNCNTDGRRHTDFLFHNPCHLLFPSYNFYRES